MDKKIRHSILTPVEENYLKQKIAEIRCEQLRSLPDDLLLDEFLRFTSTEQEIIAYSGPYGRLYWSFESGFQLDLTEDFFTDLEQVFAAYHAVRVHFFEDFVDVGSIRRGLIPQGFKSITEEVEPEEIPEELAIIEESEPEETPEEPEIIEESEPEETPEESAITEEAEPEETSEESAITEEAEPEETPEESAITEEAEPEETPEEPAITEEVATAEPVEKESAAEELDLADMDFEAEEIEDLELILQNAKDDIGDDGKSGKFKNIESDLEGLLAKMENLDQLELNAESGSEADEFSNLAFSEEEDGESGSSEEKQTIEPEPELEPVLEPEPESEPVPEPEPEQKKTLSPQELAEKKQREIEEFAGELYEQGIPDAAVEKLIEALESGKTSIDTIRANMKKVKKP